MGALTKASVVLALLAVLAAWRYFPPVPEGIVEQGKFRVLTFSFKLQDDLATVAEFLGLTTKLAFMRAAQKLLVVKTEDPSVQVTDTTFAGVKVRLYEPTGGKKTKKGPGLIYYHGGGFCVLDVDTHHHITLHLAKTLGIVVVSVDYRLAPEHVYPAALDDCVAATKHFIHNAGKYNVDPSHIAVAGDSAGGHLSTTVSLKLSQENFMPMPRLQALIYPGTQFVSLDTPSYRQSGHVYPLTNKNVAFFMSNYLVGDLSLVQTFLSHENLSDKFNSSHYADYLDPHLIDPKIPPRPPGKKMSAAEVGVNPQSKNLLHPHISPLMAEETDLKRLPKTYIAVCEHDSIRDNGILYGRRLEKAGVQVQMKHYMSGFHMVFQFFGYVPAFSRFEVGQEMMDDLVSYLREHL
ncbi:AADAC [Branchiostoma lanceolatum]|uniref:AADAC protein n=1 Tax=Branchiostoma lanceolatum TaxID=7740 RepID=A0A8K0EL47_BRALA|nr:AADAC [Branchiostoma lanceolatum]